MHAQALTLAMTFSILLGSCGGAPVDRHRILQRALSQLLQTHAVPGASVAVMIDGITTTAVSGIANVESEAPVTALTRFRTASISKTYVAALAMELADEGTLSLTDTVESRLSPLPPELGAARRATLEQLLSHTSGLPQTATRDEDRGEWLTRDELLERIPPPKCDPGDCFTYGDGNYILAAMMIERATGQTIKALMTERLLKPLSLERTSFVHTPASDAAIDLAPQYHVVTDEDGQKIHPVTYRETIFPVWEVSLAMATTATDLVRWGEALLTGRVISRRLLDQMLDVSRTRDLPVSFGEELPYGLGMYQYEQFGARVFGHDGGSGAIVLRDLDAGVTVAIVSNAGDPNVGAFTKAILDAIR